MKYFIARGEHRRLSPCTRRELRGRFAQCSDGVTHYELTGPETGELVLLTGGLTVPLFYWDQLADELHRRGFRTLAVSGYGRGYSDRPRAVYDEALFVRQLSDLTTELGLIERWHVMGASMGALVALAVTEQHVKQTATLTVIGPAGLESKLPVGAKLLRQQWLGALLGKYLGSRLLEKHLSHNVRDAEQSAALSAMVRECYVFEGSMYALVSTLADFPLVSRQDLYARAGRSGVPSLLLWGAEDRVTPINRLNEVRNLLCPVEWHVIEECGHMVPYERASNVAAKFNAFAQRAKEQVQR